MQQDPSVASDMTIEYIESLVGGVTEIYANSWNMRLNIVYTRIWPDPIADPRLGTDTPSVLDEMNAVWTEFVPYAGEWHAHTSPANRSAGASPTSRRSATSIWHRPSRAT